MIYSKLAAMITVLLASSEDPFRQVADYSKLAVRITVLLASSEDPFSTGSWLLQACRKDYCALGFFRRSISTGSWLRQAWSRDYCTHGFFRRSFQTGDWLLQACSKDSCTLGFFRRFFPTGGWNKSLKIIASINKLVIIEPDGSYEYIVYTGWQFGDNCQVIQTHSNLNRLFFQKLTWSLSAENIKSKFKNYQMFSTRIFDRWKIKGLNVFIYHLTTTLKVI